MKQAMMALIAAAILTMPAGAEDPYAISDRGWISVTGTVATTSVDDFVLDFGDGLITVEMDDWDWFHEAGQLAPGERVTVYGRIDDDLYDLRTIEASSVYVFDRDTYYYASAADEESGYPFYAPYPLAIPDGSWLSVSGIVKSVDGREFTLDTGLDEISIDTGEMAYNPMDGVGFQQIDVGDRVAVNGTMDIGFFERREIKAETITSLTPDYGNGSS